MSRCPVHIYKYLWLLAALVQLSTAPNGRQTIGTFRGNNKKPAANPDFTETVESLTQCVVLCSLKRDDCKSIGYQDRKCYLFKELHTRLDTAERYKYFEPSPVKTINYELVKTRDTFDKASESCKSKGGIMATIHDAKANNEIVNIINGHTEIKDGIWIGLRAKSTAGPFFWSDEKEISPTKKDYWHNWLYKDPDDYIRNVDYSCVRILTNDRGNYSWYTKWADTETCERKYPFFCQLENY